MPATYNTMYRCAQDLTLNNRVTSCCAQEGAANPVQAADLLRWPLATATDIADAYAYALSVNNANPGGDETVITDQMILSAVQAHLTEVVPAQ